MIIEMEFKSPTETRLLRHGIRTLPRPRPAAIMLPECAIGPSCWVETYKHKITFFLIHAPLFINAYRHEMSNKILLNVLNICINIEDNC